MMTFKPAILLLIAFCSLLFTFCFSSPAFAAGTYDTANVNARPYFEQSKIQFEANKYANVKDLNAEKMASLNVNNWINELSQLLMGVQPQTLQNYPDISYQPGAIQMAGGLIGSLVSNPPVSTPVYLADLGISLGLAKPAYAQAGTTGWNALQPVLKIWKVFRNLAYLVFVLIFVAIGFMIMFRAKINPQTVISVEAALPNLIITLIIITFSYAIASLMIDLVWVLIYLAINVFSTYGIVGVGAGKAKLMEDLLSKSVIGLGFSGALLGTGGQGIAGTAAGAIGETIESLLTQGPISSAIAGLATGLAYLIVAIAIIFSMFKVFFMLLMSYIGLILAVIFAPFQLLGNAFPGSNALSSWLKGMLANVIVFPAVAVMFMLAAALTGASTWGASSEVQVGTSGALPLLGGGDVNALKGLIGLGMIMMMPKVLEMIKAALKVEKGAVSPAGAIAPLLGVAGIPGQLPQQALTLAQMKHYILPKKEEVPREWPGAAQQAVSESSKPAVG